MTTKISVSFGDHISAERIDSMLCTLEATGDVCESDKKRSYTVYVRRDSKMPYLQDVLLQWEIYGFVKYNIE